MKPYPEMIAEGWQNIAKLEEKIAALKQEAEGASKMFEGELRQRIAQLEDNLVLDANCVKGMEEYLAAHPELNTEDETAMSKKFIDWPNLFADVDGGMNVKSAADKYHCAEVSIYNKLAERKRESGEPIPFSKPRKPTKKPPEAPQADNTFSETARISAVMNLVTAKDAEAVKTAARALIMALADQAADVWLGVT
jgi:uncharacterized coiled-coil protein SlyX